MSSIRQNLSTFNNDWYRPGKNLFVRLLWMFTSRIWVNSWFPLSNIKVIILRMFGARIGKGVVIKPYVNIKYPWRLIVGNNVWIGERVWIDNLGDVIIESDVCISQGALLLCGNHNYKKSTFDLIVGNIELKEGSWVGARAIITGGSILNTHSIISAGSVFSGTADEFTIYKGNPSLPIRKRVIEN
ncbi:MAG: WcaF family extracellular polysaccharide biosynthesis acetyltransferase [Bacteroidota bacterium]